MNKWIPRAGRNFEEQTQQQSEVKAWGWMGRLSRGFPWRRGVQRMKTLHPCCSVTADSHNSKSGTSIPTMSPERSDVPGLFWFLTVTKLGNVLKQKLLLNNILHSLLTIQWVLSKIYFSFPHLCHPQPQQHFYSAI